jgi:hypothetical protein
MYKYYCEGRNAFAIYKYIRYPWVPLSSKVARWLYFKPKIQIWVNFVGYCNGRCWYSLRPFGIFYNHLLYIMAILYIFWLFGIFPPFWYVVARKIWQPCSVHGRFINCLTRSVTERATQKIFNKNLFLQNDFFYFVLDFGRKAKGREMECCALCKDQAWQIEHHKLGIFFSTFN